jgi:phosphatidylserine decarboxylase
MARFNYGSTVILLFPRDAVELDAFAEGAPTRVGGRLGRVTAD